MAGSRKRQGITTCEVCGESRERCFEVYVGSERHIFDSFECASRGLLPRCSLCGCLILTSGVLVNDTLYCGTPCADDSYESEPKVNLPGEEARL